MSWSILCGGVWNVFYWEKLKVRTSTAVSAGVFFTGVPCRKRRSFSAPCFAKSQSQCDEPGSSRSFVEAKIRELQKRIRRLEACHSCYVTTWIQIRWFFCGCRCRCFWKMGWTVFVVRLEFIVNCTERSRWCTLLQAERQGIIRLLGKFAEHREFGDQPSESWCSHRWSSLSIWSSTSPQWWRPGCACDCRCDVK